MVFRGNAANHDYMIAVDGNKLIIVYDEDSRKKMVPVKVYKKHGFAWKLNKGSISCETGQAIDLVKLFNRYNAFANVTFRHFTGKGE